MSAYNRRQFLKTAAAASAGMCLTRWGGAGDQPADEPLFKISLAEWSFHRLLRDGKMDHLNFARVARRELEIEAVEYVNQFFMDKATDAAYIGEMKARAEGEGVKSLLIMIDDEGHLGDPDESKRTQAVENHYKWCEAAARLGCHSIRVNAHSEGSFEEQQSRAADGLRRLAEYAAGHGLNVIVENHGGLSSNGKWLSGVMKLVDKKNCGTLPDFGNFQLSETEEYDRYQGITELMPFAKGVSAKSHDFDDQGNETLTDYRRMMKIVLDAGYHGFVGIEYEGDRLREIEGVAATKRLLETVRDELS